MAIVWPRGKNSTPRSSVPNVVTDWNPKMPIVRVTTNVQNSIPFPKVATPCRSQVSKYAYAVETEFAEKERLTAIVLRIAHSWSPLVRKRHATVVPRSKWRRGRSRDSPTGERSFAMTGTYDGVIDDALHGPRSKFITMFAKLF